jgi:hypothetical protein
VELGGDGIRLNAINADQIETPLFLQFVREWAASRGVSVEEQLEVNRSRNLLGATLMPPEAVADLAVLLASDQFRFTTGDYSRWTGACLKHSPGKPIAHCPLPIANCPLPTAHSLLPKPEFTALNRASPTQSTLLHPAQGG